MYILTFQSLESTNAFALEHLAELHHGQVVFAKEQIKGKGQRGKHWVSFPLSCLTCTIVLKLGSLKYEDLPLYNIQWTSAIRNVLQEYSSIPIGIKWPNDLYSKKGKVAGILIETSRRNQEIEVCVGIGVNLSQTDESHVLPPNSAFLGENTVDHKSIISALQDALVSASESASPTAESYQSHVIGSNANIAYVSDPDRWYCIDSLSIRNDGKLDITIGSKTEVVTHGDILWDIDSLLSSL